MKLKCVSHTRRVHVLEQGVTVHREDGSRCGHVTDEPLLTIGDEVVAAKKVWLMQRNLIKRWRSNHVGQSNRRSQFWGRDHR